MSVRIFLADDHAILRQGLRSLLEGEKDFEIIGEASDGDQALEGITALQPDIAILDILMPGTNGLQVTRRVAGLTNVIILSMYSNLAYVADAMQSGARGFVLKDATATDLVQAIRDVLKGRVYLSEPFNGEMIAEYQEKLRSSQSRSSAQLTPRERQVLQLVAEGRSSAEVAVLLRISPRTVEIHRAHLLHKLDLKTPADLVRYAIQEGLIPAALKND